MHRNLHDRMKAMRADRLSSPHILAPSYFAIRASAPPKFSIATSQVKLGIDTWAGIQGGTTYNLYFVVHGLRKEAA